MKWMFTIPAVLAAMALATAWATPPTEEPSTEEAVQTITDLRAEVGPATANGPEFNEALRAQFSQAFQQPAQARPNYRQPASSVGPGPTRPQDNWAGPRDVYAPVPVQPYDPGSTALSQDFPPLPPPGSHHDRPRDPKTLLRRSAMELDRLANELEITELYGEADTLREAADKLRKAARAQAGASPKPAAEVDATNPGPSIERMKARVQNAMTDARSREAELQAQLADAKARLTQVEARARAAAERARNGEEEARRQLLRQQRRPRRADEAPTPDLPPPGVHGGPTGPGPAPTDGQPYSG